MKTISQLIDLEDPGIKIIKNWVSTSKNVIRILEPGNKHESVLHSLQVTTRSILGSLAYDTGGLLIDQGWIRILGSGSFELSRDLVSWNSKIGKDGILIFGDDANGGVFAINGGLLGYDKGQIYYLPSDGIEWEPLNCSLQEFLYFIVNGNLDQFYNGLRSSSWKIDLKELSVNECFDYYPPLWSKEGSLLLSSKTIIPVEESINLKFEYQDQLSK